MTWNSTYLPYVILDTYMKRLDLWIHKNKPSLCDTRRRAIRSYILKAVVKSTYVDTIATIKYTHFNGRKTSTNTSLKNSSRNPRLRLVVNKMDVHG